jgi:YVTN family beta-propeller protein
VTGRLQRQIRLHGKYRCQYRFGVHDRPGHRGAHGHRRSAHRYGIKPGQCGCLACQAHYSRGLHNKRGFQECFGDQPLAATVKVGWRPVDAAVTPDGGSVYVTNAGSDSVSVISTATNTVVAIIPVGDDFPAHFRWTFLDHWRRSDPVHVAITPDGTRAYVTNAGSNKVSVINTKAHAVTGTVSVGRNPLDVALTPDGTKAYVANAGSNSVSVINTGTNALVATVAVGAHPLKIAITPNGANTYVADAGANSVTVIKTATNTVVNNLRVGANPVDVSISPNGTRAYVTNAGSKSVSVIDTAAKTVVATVGVGFIPVHVSVSPDGAHAYVTNAGSNSVSVIDTSTNGVIAVVPVGLHPVNAAIF